MNIHKHDGYMTITLTAVLDGLQNALGDMVTFMKSNEGKLPTLEDRLPYDLYWVLNKDLRPRSFKWYCDVFNADPERIIEKLECFALATVNENKPIPKLKNINNSRHGMGIGMSGE